MKFAVALLIAGLFTISGLAVSAPSAGDGSALVSTKCTACHSLKRVCRGLGKKDVAAWQKTNQRMAEMGMTVSVEELGLITSYLSSIAPGDSAVCK